MRFTLALTILGIAFLACPKNLSAEENLPCLPPLEDLVQGRWTAISSKHSLDQKKLQTKIRHNKSLVDKLFLDRISGSASYGKGFVVTNEDSGETETLTATGNDEESWAVTYTIPLNLFRQRAFTVDDLEADLATLQAQQRLERQKERADITSLYNDYLESRSTYKNICTDAKCQLESGYKMRKLATSLLLLAELPEPNNCPSWECFPDTGNCTAGAQRAMDTLQVGFSEEEAKANLDWCLGNKGPADCPDRYIDGLAACVEHGNRACLMGKAVDLAKADQCANAFKLSLICQCHNPAAEQSLLAAGEAMVCDYLKTK